MNTVEREPGTLIHCSRFDHKHPRDITPQERINAPRFFAADVMQTILIVEDEWLLRDEIATVFRGAGWNVLETGSGEAAIALLETGPQVNLVLTDIQLTGPLTGWDVAEAFRAAQPNMPVVYASAKPADSKRQVSGSEFFGKPYDATTVTRTCRRLLP